MADLLAQLRTGLASSYTIERELGRGGMATVYLAHDIRHDRPVALKVLHPDLAHALGPERFQREIRLAARLQHPHILTVHDSGSLGAPGGEVLWFSMPFVEGETLRQRLTREKQLPLEDALRITREAADGLDYAHHHGIVHRDIKPENLLLSGTHALVADFGIARGLRAESEHLTETGTSIGTAAYMSPEQAAGERDLDARTDVYSLATVLYEMLAGQTPFVAATPQAMIARRFTESPKPLDQLRDSVPPFVSQAVQKALARTPADRFASAAEFAAALTPAHSISAATAPAAPAIVAAPARARRRFPVAFGTLAVGFVLGLGILFAWRRGGHGDAAAGVRMLAVLPFENLGAPDDAYFADGVADQVRGKLSELGGLQVIARASSTPYAKTTKAPRAIAEELGVRYLLTATVRWERHADGTSRVQVNPELVEIVNGTPTTRWQAPFDAALTDVFQVQTDIAGKVAQALDVALGDSARRALAGRPTGNLAAYDAYLRGEEVSNNLLVSDPVSLRRATTWYEQATALDPAFALAWSHLAFARSLLYGNGVPAPALAAAARDAAERAATLAPDAAESQWALAAYFTFVAADLGKARAAAEAGLRHAPSNPLLLGLMVSNEMNRSQWDSALVHARHVAALDPRSAVAARRLGVALRTLRHLPEAAAALDRALALAPADLHIREERAIVELARGDLARAQAVLRAAPAAVDHTALVAYVAEYFDLYWVLEDADQQLLLRLTPAAFDDDRAGWAIVMAHTHWLRGDRKVAMAYADTARVAFEQQLLAAPGDAQRHVILGVALAYLGDKAGAAREGGWASRGDERYRDYLRHQLARIYLLTGEPAKALDLLEPLVRKIGYDLTPAWLRIDPLFASLKGNPRFERLAAGQ